MTKIQSTRLQEAYAYCRRVAHRHYENFPVASLLIPREYRPYIACIYAFARGADDMADEGNRSPDERLSLLDAWEQKLDACLAGQPEDDVFIALADTAEKHGITRQPLADLLTAFRQDVTQNHYPTFDELLQYCRCSANPIGRLVLAVFRDATPSNVVHSDNICTGLQLANFWQDVSVDLRKPRVYIPLEDFDRFGYTEHQLSEGIVSERFRELIRFQVDRTEAFFRKGQPLTEAVGHALRRELRMTWHGGMAILRKIRTMQYNVLQGRPRLTAGDVAVLVARSFFGR
jgi:squalene synthase HpnC